MQKSQRFPYLDSLRGIASLMVVVYHFIGWRWSEKLWFHISAMVFNGSDAVSFFFVLSGFVLSYKYFQNNNEVEPTSYYMRRFFRIYPAFLVTILLNYFYTNRHLGIRMVTDMFYYNNQQLWQELLLVKATHKFYIPGWTLGVEAVLSLLLPLFIIAAQKNIRFVFIALITSLLIGPAYISMFTMHFCLGILLAYYLPTIQAYDFKRSAFYPYRWILAFIPFVLFSVRHVERIKPLGGKLKQFMGFWSIDLFHITGVASCIILLYVLNNSKAQQFLNKSIFMFLGKISYSLYLMHWLVVIIIMDKWEKYMYLIPNTKIYFFGMFGIYISITFILAMLLYKYVEKPMIEYAKRF